ncbi:PucR family transcriptional regulator [Aminiphilus sp.]|uniref:PucR family transcriptional regulator n=1 Tax=Aminiphilus sp. TaxID=1872488 RepID=UPI00262F39D0|nr:PucR family transcriptional regulator [Aminiphilus sp.]
MKLSTMLALDLFRGVEVVAGKEHVENQVAWINLMEILDSFEQLQPGEFLISTGYGLKDDPASAREILSQLVSHRIAGLALQPGYYIDEIPPAFVEAAEHYGLPLVRLPAKLTFGKITKALFNAIGALPSDEAGEAPLLHRQSARHLSRILLENFIDDLLDRKDTASYSDMCVRAESLGFRLDLPYQAGVVRFPSAEGRPHALEKQASLLESLTEDASLFQAAHWRLRDSCFAVLFSTTAKNVKKVFAEGFSRLFPGATPECRMGLGYPSGKLEDIPRSYEEARIAADLGKHLCRPDIVTAFRDVEALHLLRACRNREELRRFCDRTVSPLTDYDRANRTPLRETLKIYLRSLNKIRASQELFIHRQTLVYRLHKIEEITGRALENPDDRLILELGLAAESLLAAPPRQGEAARHPSEID